MMERMRWATVITDASWCPTTRAAGWAAYIRIDHEDERIKRHGFMKSPPESSSEAELQAAINGIYVAHKYGAEAVLLQSDCMSVIQMIEGDRDHFRYKTFMAILGNHGVSLKSIRAKHVKGHTDGADARHWGNNWCDEHARKRMQCQRVLIKQGQNLVRASSNALSLLR